MVGKRARTAGLFAVVAAVASASGAFGCGGDVDVRAPGADGASQEGGSGGTGQPAGGAGGAASTTSTDGCCTSDAGCGQQERCAATAAVCVPPLEPGGCWQDQDCTAGSACVGAELCPCGADCDGTDSPGSCVAVGPGCCVTDADCPPFGVCVEGAEVCQPAPPVGWCYSDAHCTAGYVCHGAAVCPCMTDCDLAHEGPGVCVPGGACAPLSPAWVQEICDAASLVVFDGASCVATCPGCCGCEPFCDLTFPSLEACEASCGGAVAAPCASHGDCGGAMLCMADEQGPGEVVCGLCGDPAACQCRVPASSFAAPCDTDADCADGSCGPGCADCPFECPTCEKGLCVYPVGYSDMCLCDGCA